VSGCDCHSVGGRGGGGVPPRLEELVAERLVPPGRTSRQEMGSAGRTSRQETG